MVVCKFYLQGNCRYGDRCKNEHPNNAMQGNRFAPLQNPNGVRGRSGAVSEVKSDQQQLKEEDYKVTLENIATDLKVGEGGDRPIWPFSCYGPGKWAPRQLLEGAVEQSMEEMRVQYYLAQANGQVQEYANKEQSLLAQVEQQVNAIKNDLQGAKRYVLEGEYQHPNRFDGVQDSTQDFPRAQAPAMSQQQSGGFGQSGFGAAGGAFGAPSQLNAPKPAFGAPSSMGSSSGFGAPSQLGGNTGFGKPSPLGGGTAFGAPSNPGQSNPFGSAIPSAFGSPSQLGQGQQSGGFAKPAGPAFGASGFGAASAKPAFGSPSLGQPASQPAFGAPSQPGANAFGAPSQPGQSTSPFGQASQPGQGASGFGQPSQIGASSSPFGGQQAQQQQQTGGNAFGAPSAFGAAANKPSPFAAAAQPQQPSSNPFGSTANNKPSPFAPAAQSQPSTGAFGAPSQPQATSSPFGSAAQQQQPPPNPFGQPSNPAPSNASPSPFAAAPAPNAAPTTTSANGKPVPQPTSFTATSFRGKPIVRDPKTGLPCISSPAPTQSDPRKQRLDRVWFPDGPPPTEGLLNPSALKDAQAPEEVYTGPLGQTLRELYEFAMREGRWKEGVMPEVPPRHEWVRWDL